jgi:nifR3 family TIM-barrel protein
MKSFWRELPKPFFALAPMEDVTDTVFRQIIAACSKPDVFFTEFTNVDGIMSVGREAVIHRLQFSEAERPLVAQLWGKNPDHYRETAKLLVEMGFDGIDINMGCPQKKVIKNGGCAALINNPDQARLIIEATKEGVGGKIPVSVKTRIGFKSIITQEWITVLLKAGIDALTVHGRTAAEMSKVPAHWDEIQKAVELRDSMRLDTLVIGNGDVSSREDGLAKWRATGVDGIMIGRGIFDDPWIFDHGVPHRLHSVKEHLDLMKKHIELFEATWGRTKQYAILRKFFKIYVKGFDGASDWRRRVTETKSTGEVYPLINELIEMMQKAI